MGNAFHRKKMVVGHSRTRGTGISYIEPDVVAPLTEQQRDAVKADAHAQALLAKHQHLSKEGSSILVNFAGDCLDAWKEEMDERDKLLVGVERVTSTETVVATATGLVVRFARECAHGDSIDIKKFIQLVTQRSVEAQQDETDLDGALGFFVSQFQEAFKEIAR
jgi:hypothetical protein